MAPTTGENGVAKEHAAAVTRNYISQPRLSKLLWIIQEHRHVPFDCFSSPLSVLNRWSLHVSRLSLQVTFDRNFCCFCFPAYKTVSGVNGPLVILDDVKVNTAQQKLKLSTLMRLIPGSEFNLRFLNIYAWTQAQPKLVLVRLGHVQGFCRFISVSLYTTIVNYL